MPEGFTPTNRICGPQNGSLRCQKSMPYFLGLTIHPSPNSVFPLTIIRKVLTSLKPQLQPSVPNKVIWCCNTPPLAPSISKISYARTCSCSTLHVYVPTLVATHLARVAQFEVRNTNLIFGALPGVHDFVHGGPGGFPDREPRSGLRGHP